MSRINKDVTVYRIEFLMQEGFRKSEISQLSGVPKVTIDKLLKDSRKKVTVKTADKIKKAHSQYIMEKANNEEPVFDFDDVEDGAKEVANWMWLSLAIIAMAIIGLIFTIRFILGLFA
jgi:hypothetical protein